MATATDGEEEDFMEDQDGQERIRLLARQFQHKLLSVPGRVEPSGIVNVPSGRKPGEVIQKTHLVSSLVLHKRGESLDPTIAQQLGIINLETGVNAFGERQVIVHVTFLKLGEINTLKEQFDADILVRSKWREPQLDNFKPESTPKVDRTSATYDTGWAPLLKHKDTPGSTIDWEAYWSPKIFIENAVGDPKVTQSRMLEFNMNGEAWVTDRRRVKGVFIEQLELWEFPFDVQDLSITVMSDLPAEEVDLIEDPDEIHKIYKQSFIDEQDLSITVMSDLPAEDVELIEDPDEVHKIYRQSFIDEQEYYLYKYLESEKREVAKDRADPTLWRATVTVRCKAARRCMYFVWNIFSVTFMITCLSFLTFAVDHQLTQNRLQLTFTLMLTSVAFKFVASQSLPRISYLTYLFLIACLSFLTFAVEAKLPQNRLQLGFTLVLTTVAFKFVVNQSLPRISYLTYLDRYILATMVTLVTICFWHGVQTVLNIKEKNDFIALVVLIGLYAIYNLQFIFRILIVPLRKRRMLSKAEKEYRATVKEQAKTTSSSFYGAPSVKTKK